MKLTISHPTMFCLLVGHFFSLSVSANEFEARGNIEAQGRYFFEDPLLDSQSNNQLSLAATPEFFWSWNDDNDSFEFVPFARVDKDDEQRTHTDIREMSWLHVGKNWETRIGVRREFWGVTEFQHLVDIINQTDAVEDIDNEDKLGQPMINLSLVQDWGIIDFYVMPYFRERTFAGPKGRPTIPFINTNNPIYESQDKQQNIDYAVRWAHTLGDFDVALSWFDGTTRLPQLLPVATGTSFELVPYYFQISQFGLELQGNIGESLIKLEAIQNSNSVQGFWALQGGIEYSQYGIFESNTDLGWLIEYSWDERGIQDLSIFQNDVFVGNRLVFNDIDSSEILFGFSYDLDFESTSFLIEASSRFGDNVKISLDARFFNADQPQDPLFLFQQDDHIQLMAQYYY